MHADSRPKHEKRLRAGMKKERLSINRLGQFTIDPIVRDRQDELAASPEGLILGGVWTFTSGRESAGLEIAEVELIPPEISPGNPEKPAAQTRIESRD